MAAKPLLTNHHMFFLIYMQVPCSRWPHGWTVRVCCSEADQAQCWEGNLHLRQEHASTNRYGNMSSGSTQFNINIKKNHNCVIPKMPCCIAPTAALMSAIYEENKDEDGFLYMTYSGENTFGLFVWVAAIINSTMPRVNRHLKKTSVYNLV